MKVYTMGEFWMKHKGWVVGVMIWPDAIDVSGAKKRTQHGAYWRTDDGVALAMGCCVGRTSPSILADWCEERTPATGEFTPQLATVLRHGTVTMTNPDGRRLVDVDLIL